MHENMQISFFADNTRSYMKKAEATCLTILQKAFELIYYKGCQTTSIDDIPASILVTKGIFYVIKQLPPFYSTNHQQTA